METKGVRIDPEFKRVYGYGEPGEYALISATDTGTGMDEKTRGKIFEPFFTTKEVGKGTGLGLSIVYGIVKQHSGYISVDSKPGMGTVFRIYLPAVKAEVCKTGRVAVDVKGGTETILFAEDNPDIRRITGEILRMSGYRVIEATDGEDAIRKFMEHRDAIDLLVLDVVMPVKNGKEAYDEIKTIRRDIRVLFMSGHTGDVVLDKGVEDKAFDYISKPLSPNELLRKVRQVLDK